jgi:hypothetical protein
MNQTAIIDRVRSRLREVPPGVLTWPVAVRLFVDEMVHEVIPFVLAEVERQQALAALDGEDYLRAL